MREKFKKKFYEFKKLLFHRNTAPFVLAEPLQLYTNAHSAAFATQNCSEHLFYCFTGVPTPGCSQNPSLYTNAHSAAFAAQNCTEHSFYCFTGIPHLSCSQNPSSYTQMPLTQLLRSKTAASTCFTVSPVFQRQGARIPRTPQVAKSMLR